jgi:hypothetical protein
MCCVGEVIVESVSRLQKGWSRGSPVFRVLLKQLYTKFNISGTHYTLVSLVGGLAWNCFVDHRLAREMGNVGGVESLGKAWRNYDITEVKLNGADKLACYC